MEKLNELVEKAKEMAELHGTEWSSALCESGQGDIGRKHHTIISESKNDFVVDTNSDSNEASWLCDYLELCSPGNILAIAEAFRALEKRAEAAEAKLAECEKQEPVASRLKIKDEYDSQLDSYQYWDNPAPHRQPLFTRPAPAVVPDGWKLVPVEPNWEMLSADGCKEHHKGQLCLHHDNRRRIWSAMLAAAPAPHE